MAQCIRQTKFDPVDAFEQQFTHSIYHPVATVRIARSTERNYRGYRLGLLYP